MTSTADYGQPTDPLSAPSLSAWAAAVHAGKVGYARTPNPATGDLGLPGYAGSDTGWRDVSALLENGWTGTYRVRRVGSTVHHQVYNIAGGSNPVLTLPVGWRQGYNPGSATAYAVNSLTAMGAARMINGQTNLHGGAVAYTGTYLGWSYPTEDAWPATLPGTQVTPPAGA